MIRVTQLTFFRQTTKDILAQENLLYKLNNQLSAGKRILAPSDDPMGTIWAQDAHRNLEELEQYQTNVSYAQDWLQQSEATMNSLNDALARAKELAEQVSTGTYTSDQREAVAQDVNNLIEQIINIMNVEVGQSYIFAGSANDRPALSLDLQVQNPSTPAAANTAVGLVYGQGEYTGQLSTEVTLTVDPAYAGGVPGTPPGNDLILNYSYFNDLGEEVTGTATVAGVGTGFAVDLLDENLAPSGIQVYAEDRAYAAGDSFSLAVGRLQGNSEDLQVNLSRDNRMSYNYTLDDLLGAEGLVNGERENILDNLINWRNALTNDENDGMGQEVSQDMLTTLETAMTNLLQSQADAGAKLNRLEVRETLLGDDALRMDERLTQIEDVDVVEVSSTLALYDILYQATLKGMTMINDRSLADYL
jgi:flagellin-like hook-associated protein FlgL